MLLTDIDNVMAEVVYFLSYSTLNHSSSLSIWKAAPEIECSLQSANNIPDKCRMASWD